MSTTSTTANYHGSLTYPPKVSLEREKATRAAFEKITGEPFTKVRPRWLRNPASGRNLELDGYNENLKIAFEHQGIQHDQFPNVWHRTRQEFEEQRARDALKIELCKCADVYLIHVPHTVEFDDLFDYIEYELCDFACAEHLLRLKEMTPCRIKCS